MPEPASTSCWGFPQTLILGNGLGTVMDGSGSLVSFATGAEEVGRGHLHPLELILVQDLLVFIGLRSQLTDNRRHPTTSPHARSDSKTIPILVW